MNIWEHQALAAAEAVAAKAAKVVTTEVKVVKEHNPNLGEKVLHGLEAAGGAVLHEIEKVIHPGAASPQGSSAPATPAATPQAADHSPERKQQLLDELHKLEAEVEGL